MSAPIMNRSLRWVASHFHLFLCGAVLGCSSEDHVSSATSTGAISSATTSGGGSSSGGSSGSSSGSQGGAGTSGGSSGAGGSGGAAGNAPDGDASADAGQGDAGIDSGTPLSDAANDAEASADGGSRCSPACSGPTPICDEAAATCKAIELIGIYTQYEQNPDLAHRSYVREANAWLPMMAQANGYSYQSTTDWEKLKTIAPAPGRVVMFLDDKPKDAGQQAAFKSYMEGGGAWIGCHFAAFFPNPADWDWFFNQFLMSGGYGGNTWRPTSANLKVEDPSHPISKGLGSGFKAAPNEWYKFQVDLRTKSNIKILLSIDPSSFPLGTGPKPEEIWHSGYYPVVWTNTNYKMVYVNMGHNDMDYGGTNQALSSTFSSPTQNRMLLNLIRWLGGVKNP
jgi:hypothetical protein